MIPSSETDSMTFLLQQVANKTWPALQVATRTQTRLHVTRCQSRLFPAKAAAPWYEEECMNSPWKFSDPQLQFVVSN